VIKDGIVQAGAIDLDPLPVGAEQQNPSNQVVVVMLLCCNCNDSDSSKVGE
jgi:hypothetical protein